MLCVSCTTSWVILYSLYRGYGADLITTVDAESQDVAYKVEMLNQEDEVLNQKLHVTCLVAQCGKCM